MPYVIARESVTLQQLRDSMVRILCAHVNDMDGPLASRLQPIREPLAELTKVSGKGA